MTAVIMQGLVQTLGATRRAESRSSIDTVVVREKTTGCDHRRRVFDSHGVASVVPSGLLVANLIKDVSRWVRWDGRTNHPEIGGQGGRTFSVRQLINLQRFVITRTCWKVRIPYFLFSDKCVFLTIRKRCAVCALRKKGARPALEGLRYLASAACLFPQLQLHVMQKLA
jgi:hypothetical protein